MIDRAEVEIWGQRGAGIISETEDWYLVKVLNHFEMYVHKKDKSLTPHLVGEGFWESWITAWVSNHCGPGTVFYDIGANSGYYSLVAMAAGAMVSAYEPNPVYAEMLRATAEHNKLGNLFRVNEVALSDYNGEATLHIPTELHGSASLSVIPGYETKAVTVPVRSFDEYTGGQAGAGVRLIKIDAEGEEEKILRGMRRYLKTCIPSPTILMEYTPNAYSEYFLADLFNEWNVSFINYGGYESAVSPEGLMQATDWVMLVLRPKKP